MMDNSGVTHKIKNCIGNAVNKNNSKIDMSTLYPDKSDKWSVKLQMFYNKHFPTDKDSYAIRMPVIALVLSLCSIQIFTRYQWRESREGRYYIWAILVFLGAATYGLYYGIKIGDRKQFTPWIVLKMIEIFITAVTLVNIISGRYVYGDRLIAVIIGFIVIGGNLLMVSVVFLKKRSIVQEFPDTDEFSPVITSP